MTRSKLSVLCRGIVLAATLLCCVLPAAWHLPSAYADPATASSATAPAAVLASAAPASAAPAAPVVTTTPRVAATTDPIDTTQGSVDSAWQAIADYGPLWGGQLLLFALGTAFVRRNNQDHWLAQGRTLSLITTGLMMLGAVLTWKFRGGDTAGLLMSLFLAIKMLVSPSPTSGSSTQATDSTSGRVPQAGHVRLGLICGLVVGLGLLLEIVACARLSNDVDAVPGAAKAAIVDCAKADAGSITAVLAELGADVATTALGSGTVDWNRLVADAAAQGEVVGGCALTEFVAALEASDRATQQSKPAPVSGTLAPRVATASVSTGGRAAIDKLRAQTKTTAQYQVAGQRY